MLMRMDVPGREGPMIRLKHILAYLDAKNCPQHYDFNSDDESDYEKGLEVCIDLEEQSIGVPAIHQVAELSLRIQKGNR